MKDFFLLIVGREKHICNNTIELNNLHSEDFRIQSIFIYQNILNSVNHPIILQALYILSRYCQKFHNTIKKNVNVIQHILKLCAHMKNLIRYWTYTLNLHITLNAFTCIY